MMFKLASVLFLLCSSLLLSAQQNAELLVSFNKETLQLLERKPSSNFLQSLEAQFLKEAGANGELLRSIYEHPEKIGLSTENHIVGFVDIVGGFAHIGLQFPLLDPALFEDNVRQYGRNSLKNVAPISSTIENERIRAQLEASRNQQLERRGNLYRVQLVEGTRKKYVLGANWTLAWTSTHGYLLKTQALNANQAINFSNENYSVQRRDTEEAKLNYIAALSPIVWRDHSHDIVAQLSTIIAQRLNAASTEESAAPSPMEVLFNRAIELPEVAQRLEIDFEAAALIVRLLENTAINERQVWSLSELTRNWENLEIEEDEDSLDVWLKVLGQRFRF
jgi:hypothetical protein